MAKEVISLTLSERALKAIDKLEKISDFGSRSRTIEEIILSFDQIVDIYQAMLKHSEKDDKLGMRAVPVEHIKIFMNKLDVILNRLGISTHLKTFLSDKK